MPVFSNDNVINSAKAYEIDNSLRFNDDDSAYLNWTPSSAGNRKTWTFSCWVKLGAIDTSRALFYGGDGSASPWETGISINSAYQISTSINGTLSLKTTALYRDPSAWYHIVWAIDTTQATASNRAKLYVNGSEITDVVGSPNYPAQNDTPGLNNNKIHKIGQYSHATSGKWDGYMAEVNFIDGLALTPSSFGETDATWGHWKPKTYDGVFGTNGFYLNMKQDTTNNHFNTSLYTGNSTNNRSVGSFGFQPDLVWVKRRSASERHMLTSVLNTTESTNIKWLDASANNGEFGSSGLKSFNSDGFTLGNWDSTWNQSGHTYVAWGWKAGGG